MPGSPAAGTRPAQTGSRLVITPRARRVADEAGLDPTGVTGTGPNGRIRRRDVEGALASRGASPGRHREVGTGLAGQVLAPHAVEPPAPVPHVFVRATADVGALLALRDELDDGTRGAVSVTELLVAAMAAATQRHPELNVVRVGGVVRPAPQVDIGLAVPGRGGVVTPVLRRVEAMRLGEVSAAVREAVDRARSGSVSPEELGGGSITLRDLGGSGVEELSAGVTAGQAATLAAGAIREEPVVRQGRVEVGRVLHLVLSLDPGAADIADAAAWLRTLVSLLERPVRILA